MQKANVRFEIRLTPELAALVDRWRAKQSDIPPRAEAFRRLAEIGLEAEKEGARPPKAK